MFFPILMLCCAISNAQAPATEDVTVSPDSALSRYVDPRIGSQGKGRVFIGPCAPFGMAKPSPDAETMPNAGWAEMPQKIKGFSQTHVSGTGGGQKYGNILLQPLTKNDTSTTKTVLDADGTITSVPTYLAQRSEEQISPAYYSCTFTNGIRTEITASNRCALYRFTASDMLWLDCVSFLGMDTIPDKRETQQRVGSAITIISENEITGWTSVRGGWNNGDAYKLFFCLKTDSPFRIVQQDSLTALLKWQNPNNTTKTCKIGLSYVSVDQARQNITTNNFNAQRAETLKQWDAMLSRVPYIGNAREKRIFYTALYHVLLMPTNKTGENPRLWTGDYWDDFYAIWDTYRTSFPLLMEYFPQEAASMVRSLLNIYKYEGFMPDARSGDCNGRTQGGSNAEVVIADAYARGLKNIDYDLALEAMIHDAEVAPANDEKEGRGGLTEYNSLGYIPYGIPRAGSRTVEYSYNDWCIAQVAKGLGHDALYNKYISRSSNWKNLWRADYSWQGMTGFIMPRDADGLWLDSVVWGNSKVFHPKIAYVPDTKVAPWHIAWWNTFFYEALSAEYSLSVPHDVNGLIALCGGADNFLKRLDIFFSTGHYNVGNEPSFLTPYLYHYIARPDLSSQRIAQIVSDNFSDAPDGLPGNDDSGAMSAWLIWSMLGKYPALPGAKLSQIKDFYGNNLSSSDHYIFFSPVHFAPSAQQKQQPSPTTANISTPTDEKFNPSTIYLPSEQSSVVGSVSFTLNRQFRKWQVSTQWQNDTLSLYCNGCLYNIPRQAIENAHSFCWQSPYRPGKKYTTNATFLFLSHHALQQLLTTGTTTYDTITYRTISHKDNILHIKADTDNTEMWILTNTPIPWIIKTTNNPLNINWSISLHNSPY